jgi:hypothetical protein
MSKMTEYEKRLEERRIIKKETKLTIMISVGLLITCIIYGLIAYFIKIKPTMTGAEQDKLYGMINLIIILIFIGIVAARRTLYYSPRIIQEDFNLTQVMKQWRKIDIVLLAIAETIPICGLVLAFLGMPFDKTFHFFLGSALLMVILMPVGIKVRSKLSILKEHFPENKFV